MIAIALMLADVAPAATPALDLHLICVGGGLADQDDSKSVHGTTSDGKSVNGTVHSETHVPYKAQLEFVFTKGGGRIRWPMSLIAPLNRAKDGWTTLEKIKISDYEIEAMTKMNFANHPHFRIDRVHGTIEMAAWGASFQGTCTPYKPDDQPRAF